MGELIPAFFTSFLSLVVLLLWLLTSKGELKKRFLFLFIGLIVLVTAWVLIVPNIYTSESWKLFILLSFVFTALPMFIPWLWNKYEQTKNT